MSTDLTPSFARALAERYDLAFVDLAAEAPEEEALSALPAHLLERAGAVPYRLADGVLYIAITDPADVSTIDELRLASLRPVKLAVAARADVDRFWHDQQIQPDTAPTESGAFEGGAPAVRILAGILQRAQQLGASDVHLVPDSESLAVRARIDGVVHDLDRVDGENAIAVIARLKALAGLDIAEHRRPQGGRLPAAGDCIGARVAVLPTVDGEGAVLRLMENEAEPPTLTSLGLTNEMQMALDRIISRPTGGLLVTGPTGSGKSTTLYAAMADIVHPQINAIMIEDPVERRLPGTFQMQVDERAGVDYAAALRSVLRADPDVLMVGEIRDPETARLTMGVSIAGHLVLSTLHTDDAPTAITRLLDMGVEPYLVASGTTAVLAQRLARRLCPACRDAYRPTLEELLSLGYDEARAQSGEIELWRAIGCGQCRGGYRGRIGIFQLLLITPEIRRLTIEHSGREAIESAAKAAGMGSQWADGLAKAEQGLTSVDELWRVLT